VLSFPAAAAPSIAPRHLGDIAISYETTIREAQAEARPFAIILPILRCTASCTSWATIINRMQPPRGWKTSSARSSRGSAYPILTECRPISTPMPEPDAPSRNEPTGARSERYQLPVPVPRVSEAAGNGASWFVRMLRAWFGWKPGSIRADLQVVLEAGAAGETGFSPEERAMLKNILGLRERRVEDVMVPRADIVAVQQ